MLSDKARQECIDAITAYFEIEQDEEIGVIAAEEILELVQESITNDVYNRGVDDALKLLQTKLGDASVEIDLLKR